MLVWLHSNIRRSNSLLITCRTRESDTEIGVSVWVISSDWRFEVSETLSRIAYFNKINAEKTKSVKCVPTQNRSRTCKRIFQEWSNWFIITHYNKINAEKLDSVLQYINPNIRSNWILITHLIIVWCRV